MKTQAKAIVAAILAVLVAFGSQLLQSDNVNWRTIVFALVSAIVTQQGVYWTVNKAPVAKGLDQSPVVPPNPDVTPPAK